MATIYLAVDAVTGILIPMRGSEGDYRPPCTDRCEYADPDPHEG